MLEGRDLGERMPRQVELFAVSTKRHVDEFVRDAFFCQGQTRTPHIGAQGRAVDDWVGHWLQTYFFDDCPVRAGVPPLLLLSKAPKMAAALSRLVPWPPVDTTVCGTKRPISDTISGLSSIAFSICWTRVIVSTRSWPSTSACARCPCATSSNSSFWPSPRSFAAFLFCSATCTPISASTSWCCCSAVARAFSVSIRWVCAFCSCW